MNTNEQTLDETLATIQKRIASSPKKIEPLPATSEQDAKPTSRPEKPHTKNAELVDMRLASRIITSSFDHAITKNLGKYNLLKFLREKGILHTQGGLKNVAKLAYIEKGYFKTVNVIRMQGEIEHVYIKTLVTSTGIPFIASLIEQEIKNQTQAAQKKTTKTATVYAIDYLAKQAD